MSKEAIVASLQAASLHLTEGTMKNYNEIIT